MPLYEITSALIQPLEETSFAKAGLKERSDLQRLLRAKIDIISPDTLVIAEEFGDWEDSKRRIDLLGLDKNANLVVIELKRTDDGGHMDLQALRYAAMISTMTFDQVVEEFGSYLKRLGSADDPHTVILDFLGWDEPDDDRFAQDIRITLAAADFSREITTAVLWLNQRGLDLRCVRLRPYSYRERVLLDVQQVIPLPEAADYQVRLREKAQRERVARQSAGSKDYTRFTVTTPNGVWNTLPKRRAVLEVVKGLVASGVQIAEMQNILEPTHTYGARATLTMPGHLNSEEFMARATSEAFSNGRSFDPKRYFCGDDELLHGNDHTSAVTNQWGEQTADAINRLVKSFPEAGISVTPFEPVI